MAGKTPFGRKNISSAVYKLILLASALKSLTQLS